VSAAASQTGPSDGDPRLRGLPPDEYGGYCRRCSREHLFRNDVSRARSALDELFRQLLDDPAFAEEHRALATSRGKMIGVLVAETIEGVPRLLRAYSGELAGRRDWPAWVGPVLRRADTAALEAETLTRISELNLQISACDVEGAQRHLVDTRAAVQAAAAERRQARRAQRQTWSRARLHGDDSVALEARVEEAKRSQSAAGAADAARVETARRALLDVRERLHGLTEARRHASVTLSTAMFDAATVTSARGEERPLREIFVGTGIAGGTTDCAVPKLLEAANVARLRPVALGEAWWGPTINGRHHGDIQLPCERKCKPVLGHLLCGRDEA